MDNPKEGIKSATSEHHLKQEMAVSTQRVEATPSLEGETEESTLAMEPAPASSSAGVQVSVVGLESQTLNRNAPELSPIASSSMLMTEPAPALSDEEDGMDNNDRVVSEKELCVQPDEDGDVKCVKCGTKVGVEVLCKKCKSGPRAAKDEEEEEPTKSPGRGTSF